MSKFQFKLETLLTIRRSRRDQCRQVLAEVLGRDNELADAMERTVQMRLAQLQELRDLNHAGELDVDALSSRRYFAGQLTAEIAHIERQRQFVAAQIEMCRQTLVKADQDVKALENLKEKQQHEFERLQEQRAQRELEDNWSSKQRDKVPTC